MNATTAKKHTLAADALVASLADRCDRAGQGEGKLAASVLRRLHALQAASGKTCERCRAHKPLTAFSRHARNPDGLRRYCRNCANSAESDRVNGRSGAVVALYTSEREKSRTSTGSGATSRME